MDPFRHTKSTRKRKPSPPSGLWSPKLPERSMEGPNKKLKELAFTNKRRLFKMEKPRMKNRPRNFKNSKLRKPNKDRESKIKRGRGLRHRPRNKNSNKPPMATEGSLINLRSPRRNQKNHPRSLSNQKRKINKTRKNLKISESKTPSPQRNRRTKNQRRMRIKTSARKKPPDPTPHPKTDGSLSKLLIFPFRPYPSQ